MAHLKRLHEKRETFSGYGNGSEPLPAYAALIGVFGIAFAGLCFAASRKRKLPSRIKTDDLLLLGVASHKLSRVITKDRVTSPLRAPFAKFEEPAGAGELEEEARGTGIQRAIGKLLICPYCFGMWSASPFGFAFAFDRRMTRFIASVLGILAISDFLNHFYARLKPGR